MLGGESDSSVVYHHHHVTTLNMILLQQTWWFGVFSIDHISEVAVRQVQSVLRWVTVSGLNSPCGNTTFQKY